MVMVGRVTRPHGNRGHVVVHPETDFADERFQVGARVFIERDGGVEALAVIASRPHDGRWIVGFEGVPSIDAAETLRGLELKIPADEIRALPPDAYYVHDLVGCEVRTVQGASIGRVERVDMGSGIPMLVVASDGDEVLVPFSAAMGLRVDLTARVIDVDPPEGLIELNRRVRR